MATLESLVNKIKDSPPGRAVTTAVKYVDTALEPIKPYYHAFTQTIDNAFQYIAELPGINQGLRKFYSAYENLTNKFQEKGNSDSAISPAYKAAYHILNTGKSLATSRALVYANLAVGTAQLAASPWVPALLIPAGKNFLDFAVLSLLRVGGNLNKRVQPMSDYMKLILKRVYDQNSLTPAPNPAF